MRRRGHRMKALQLHQQHPHVAVPNRLETPSAAMASVTRLVEVEAARMEEEEEAEEAARMEEEEAEAVVEAVAAASAPRCRTTTDRLVAQCPSTAAALGPIPGALTAVVVALKWQLLVPTVAPLRVVVARPVLLDVMRCGSKNAGSF